jgi:tRNA (adenine57-N1/adenine58-N1)-methyltransferase catalytic subunit
LVWNLHGTTAQEDDLAELVGLRHKHFIIRLKSGSAFHTHRGVLQHDDLIGKPWGCQVYSHNGSPFFLLQPSLTDLLRNTPRNTQILYAKDIGYVLLRLGVGPGSHVIEAGTGSGAMTTAFAYSVGNEGHVYSYEAREDMQSLARQNLERVGLDGRVSLKLRNISEGFEETGVDALFLDVPNPYDYIAQVQQSLKPGGFFASILPTINQVSKILVALKQYKFAFIEVCEMSLRFWKIEPERMRPTDRMVAHTGFLIFARPILIMPDAGSSELLEEAGVETDSETDPY